MRMIYGGERLSQLYVHLKLVEFFQDFSLKKKDLRNPFIFHKIMTITNNEMKPS